VEAAKDADILVFVLPHQFIRTLCSTLLNHIKPTAIGLSLIKVGLKQLPPFVQLNLSNQAVEVPDCRVSVEVRGIPSS
jgi:glycerol-3-phosphate dehydrogenase